MSIHNLLKVLFFVVTFLSYSQEKYYSYYNIESDLLKNANAVVRYDNIHINIEAFDKMVYTNKRIVTVLNEGGDKKLGAYHYYNNGIDIKKIEARVYNANGNEIKKIKKKDFKDVSAVSGGTLYSENRVKYLDYTSTTYPYTMVFEIEVTYKTTAFLPGWRIIEGFNISTENAEYKITNKSGIDVRIKTSNFEEFDIEQLGNYHFVANNLMAIKQEEYSPSFKTYAPLLKATLTEFNIEGVKGSNNNWQDFGKWVNDELISDTQALPQSVKDEIKDITKSATSKIEKAKLVYKYVQEKTRYISVQIGIGGWKPTLASDVARLGYGDCKGLSNYTKALLDEVGVESYYTVIYGDNELMNIDQSFSSLQGNHVILSVPNESNYIWLECTSQTAPFGYNANFTDDRDALIVTPDGGKIVHTKVYETGENVLNTKANIVLDVSGNFTATINSNSYGTQYGYHEGVQNETLKDQKLHYKDYWNYINNLKITSIDHKNNKDSIVFTENLTLGATKYASKTGSRLLLQPNFFNRIEEAPKRYTKRKLPFIVERGLTHIDNYEITLSKVLEVEAITEPIAISNKFGEYKASVENAEGKLIYKRKFVLNKGAYLKEEYDDFRKFWIDVIKHDRSKIVLKNKL